MRTIHVDQITNAVAKMCMEANFHLPDDVKQRLIEMKNKEESPIGVGILEDIILNANMASENEVPMCQDTGMAVFFIELGQSLMIEGGLLVDAVNEGVRQGYTKGFLRKSVVADPLRRKNTGDNTPAVIHLDLVDGDRLKIVFAPKGFGSENMSRSKMLKPADGVDGVIDFVLKTVSLAGPNPCPPIVVGVGIGGTLDKAAQIAKHALTREIGSVHGDDYYQELETLLLTKVNALGIGPQGLGGKTTCIAVHVEAYPTHIAGLPVVVNINCHAARHDEVIL
ncbi:MULTISPECIES: fumarate hydratase [unclassified Fusibacter]|uniref:fumarate hydratase n=1 Tax=unclassified Fusibacter TaxID=2624464 RepID=UPI001012E5F4|nr:fumarate hydratase [Fusibacter sp. A1]MCK8059534.1 fumarate hydratase [Fusibacter sp. A2]NPE21002.1 fumarate hydratase [Fusibacter sp. A1]RXV62276.1 fumarate hydratase [Fusibacter sp. A1]